MKETGDSEILLKLTSYFPSALLVDSTAYVPSQLILFNSQTQILK